MTPAISCRPFLGLLAAVCLLPPLAGCGTEEASVAPPSVEDDALELVAELGDGADGFFLAEPVALVGSWGDTLWILDRGRDRIFAFTAGRGPVDRIGGSGSGPGELRQPSDMVLSQGRLGVLDSGNGRFQWLAPTGEHIASFGLENGERNAETLTSGALVLYNPTQLLRSGAEAGRPHLAYLYADTGFTGRGFGRYRAGLGDPLVSGLANHRSAMSDEDGGLWLAETLSGTLVRYGPDGGEVESVRRPLSFQPRGFSEGFSTAEYARQRGASVGSDGLVPGAPGEHRMADLVTGPGARGPGGCLYLLTFLEPLRGTDAAPQGKLGVDVLTHRGRLVRRLRVADYYATALHVDEDGLLVLASASTATVRVYRPRAPLCPARPDG